MPGDGTTWEAKYEFFTTAPSPPEPFKAGAGWLPSDAASSPSGSRSHPMGGRSRRLSATSLFDAKGAAIEGGGEATGRGVRIDF